MSDSKTKTLPERPDLDHLKKQARDLLSLEREGLPDDPERRLDLMFEAIEQNDSVRVKLLLELDASLAHGWGERRPLAHAVQYDREEVVVLLVGAGVAPTADYGFPHDSLGWAITVGGLRAARGLVSLGAPLDLWCAAGLGERERLNDFFDEHGRPIPGASRHGVTRFDDAGKVLPKPPTDSVEIVSDALYIASRNGQLEAARYLLDRGADPNFLGFNGAPVLHWAAFSGNQALVRLLLERGADPQRLDGSYRATYRVFGVRNAIEWSLHHALSRILAGDPSLARERDASWGPPLHAAAEKGLDDHVQTLLEYGADPLETDATGRTALERARAAVDASARARVVAMLEAVG
jgi:ankyrin repeat protein